MAKLKKSEAFTVERDREIRQASEDLSTISLLTLIFNLYLSERIHFHFKGCRFCK